MSALLATNISGNEVRQNELPEHRISYPSDELIMYEGRNTHNSVCKKSVQDKGSVEFH